MFQLSPMTALEQLKAIVGERYVSENDEVFTLTLKNGLSDHEIDEAAAQLPTGRIPAEIRELLKYAAGFDFPGIGEVSFDGVGWFGLDELFPFSVQLAGDGFGNFWILDVNRKGQWGNVFFVCHDPAVIVKQSDDLAQFIQQVDEFGKKGAASTLDIIHEKTCMEIYRNEDGFMDLTSARNSADDILRAFALQLPDDYVIADLRNKPNYAGFAWGKFGPRTDNVIRHDSELLWAFEKKGHHPPSTRGFWGRLFGR